MKYSTIIIKKKKVLILCLRYLTIIIKDKTGLSKVLATEKSSKSGSEITKGNAKPVRRSRSPERFQRNSGFLEAGGGRWGHSARAL